MRTNGQSVPRNGQNDLRLRESRHLEEKGNATNSKYENGEIKPLPIRHKMCSQCTDRGSLIHDSGRSLRFKSSAICLPWKRPFSMKISLVRDPATITPAT